MIGQLSIAIDLLQICVFNQNNNRKMWAYIFNEQNQRIAGISLQDDVDGRVPSMEYEIS